MIEQGIYFALGCIVTALCALMFAPVFWSRALRLTRQRLQLQIPTSMREIYAERDQLRAAFAVDRLRLEQDLERVQAGKASDMAEIGRGAVAVTRVSEQLAAARADIEKLEAELAAVRQTLADREAEIVRLRDAEQQALAQAARHEAEGAAKLSLAEAAHEATRNETRERIDALGGELTAASAALAGAQEREKSLHLQNSLKAERGRAAERSAAERIESLEAEVAALQAALKASEEAPRESPFLDDGGLRKSIHELGLAVAAMTNQTGTGQTGTRQAGTGQTGR